MEQTKHITKRYEVIDKLGQGGMGAVWRVYDRLAKTEVALKQVLIPEAQLDFASKAGTDDTNKLRVSLAQEFSILATLRHPHILSVLDYGFDLTGHPFYTMTLLEGGMDFKSYAEDLSQTEKVRVLTQMLQALHYLHRRGILHRDLKPDNVLIDQDGQVKVMDFGLAKKENTDSHQSTKEGNLSGTIMYMSPELFHDEKASVSSDLFAFGLMAYEILVGKYPFEFNSIVSLIMKLMTESPDTSSLSTELADWLDQLLHNNPAERPQSAYDALHGLYNAQQLAMSPETQVIRESFLQASEFIGRNTELEQLTDALNTLDDTSVFFLVGGESGVGKSRLLDELRIEALVRNALVMRGQGVEGGGLSFQLWRDIIRRMLLVVEVTDLQASILKDIVSDMDELLQREISKVPELTGKAYQERIVLAIVDLFRNLQRPVVLLLEDLQWTDESLTVLQQILKVPEQLPKLMVIATYRDNEAPELREKLSVMTHIKLERLTADAVSELSSAMLGDVGMNEDVVQLLYRQSEGNLFFLVETVQALAEASGDLQRIGEGKLPEGVFTGNMQVITRRHLSKVDEKYRAIQTLAAVIGREIDTELLAQAFDDKTVKAWLSNAADYNVVNIQDNAWRFAHDKLRETLIADIADDELLTIHRTAAETIEVVYPHDTGYNEALLNHWQQVGDLDKSYQYVLLVAENRILIQGAHTTGETLLHHLLDRLNEDDARCIALWNWLSDSTHRQSAYDASQEYAKKAQDLATKKDDLTGLAKSLKNLGAIATAQGNFTHAIDLQKQSLALHQQLGDQRGIASNLHDLGRIAQNQADYTHAADLFRQSLDLFQQLGDLQGIAHSLNSLAIIVWYQGDPAQSTELFQQSLALRQKLGDQRGIADCINNLGVLANVKGDYARATDLFEQSLERLQQMGDKRRVASILMNLGVLAKNQEDYVRAADLYRQSLALRQKLGIQRDIANSFYNLGVLADIQGDYARATDLYQQSLTGFQQVGDQRGIAMSLSSIGAIAYFQEDYARAIDLFQQGLALSRQIGDQNSIALNLNRIGLAKQEQGQSPLQEFSQSLAIVQDTQDVSLILANILGFADHLMRQGQIERAAKIVGLVQHHHALKTNNRKDLDEIMPQLEAALSSEVLQAALERGKELDLDTVVRELLDEFAPLEDKL